MEEFLVVTKHDDGAESVSLQTPLEIISRVDMNDCTNEEIDVYRVRFGRNPQLLHVLGTWHMIDDPLYIAVVDDSGAIVFDGYGTDH